jgi:hypothetical protein
MRVHHKSNGWSLQERSFHRNLDIPIYMEITDEYFCSC